MSALGTKYQIFHWLCIGTRNVWNLKIQILLVCTWNLCPWPFQGDKNNTLHWNQKYLKSQDTNFVSLHLKLLLLTFPRRQKQCLRKSIDFLDNRCPWLDWQVILKVTGLYLLAPAPKMHLTKKYGEFEFFKVTFSRKPSWPCGGHVTSTGLFFYFAKIRNQNGGLANRTKLTNMAKNTDQKLTRQGGFSELYLFLRDMATKNGKKTNTLRNTWLTLAVQF